MSLRRSSTRILMVGVALVLAGLGLVLFDTRIDEEQGLDAGDTTASSHSDSQPPTSAPTAASYGSTQIPGRDPADPEALTVRDVPDASGIPTDPVNEVDGDPVASPSSEGQARPITPATVSPATVSPATVSPTTAAAAKTDSGKPVIHLTFDDGPSELTPRVMDLLERYNAKGTFFVMGQAVEQHPDIARQIVERGHAIGNHSYDHMDWRQAGARQDIIRTQSIIKSQTGVTPSCARPPFGADSPELIATLASQGMASWRWDLATEDHDERKYLVEQTLNTIPQVQKIWGAEGKIVLQHDSDLLLGPSIDGLEAWLAKNAAKYEFKVIDNCLNYQ